LTEGRGRAKGAGKKGHSVVRVTVYRDRTPTVIRIFDVITGRLLEEETPD